MSLKSLASKALSFASSSHRTGSDGKSPTGRTTTHTNQHSSPKAAAETAVREVSKAIKHR